MLLKPRYSLIKFLLCGPRQLVLTLHPIRVSKVHFFLTVSVQYINKREGYENKQNDHSEEKNLYTGIFYKQSLSTNSLRRCVEVNLATLYLHFVVLRVIRIIWDIELVH